MAYRIRKRESIEDAFKRILLEETARSRLECRDTALTPARATHQLRKRCKRFRGLIALYRDSLGPTAMEQGRRLRDVARSLATARTEQVLADLAVDVGVELPISHDPIPSTLQSGHLQTIGDALEDIARTCIRDRGPADEGTLICGFAEIVRRSGRAWKMAKRSPGTETLHRWRTWAKRYWYAVRLTQNLAGRRAGKLRSDLAKIGNLVGQDHDLSILLERMPVPVSQDDRDERSRITGLRDSVRRKALKLGKRVHPRSPLKFARRFTGGISV